MECPVCLETKHQFVWFGCAHHVCAQCSARMAEFKHTECPLCRFQIKAPVKAPAAPVAEEVARDCTNELQFIVCGMAGVGVAMTCLAATIMHTL